MSSQIGVPDGLETPNNNHARWLFRRIWDRIHEENEHFMGVIVGREGSGKSYSAVKIAESIDPTFSSDRIIFDVAELLEHLRDGNHEPGQFYVLDEAGVQLGKRTWQDRAQILANQALQLIRDHNLGLIFTLPRMSELDSQAQGRMQAMIEMTDKEDGVWAEMKWKWLDPDRTGETGKVYKKYPRRRVNGALVRVKTIRLTPPSKAVIEPYEERKDRFQEEFYDDVIEALDDSEDGDDKDDGPENPQELADMVIDDGVGRVVSEHGNTGKPYIDKNLIRALHDCTHRDAQSAKSIIEKRTEEDDLEQYV